ncbi:unnamed protein product, partial [Prorocentrum cordatum]
PARRRRRRRGPPAACPPAPPRSTTAPRGAAGSPLGDRGLRRGEGHVRAGYTADGPPGQGPGRACRAAGGCGVAGRAHAADTGAGRRPGLRGEMEHTAAGTPSMRQQLEQARATSRDGLQAAEEWKRRHDRLFAEHEGLRAEHARLRAENDDLLYVAELARAEVERSEEERAGLREALAGAEADSMEHRSPQKHGLRSPAPPSEATETTAAPASTMSPPSARRVVRDFGWEPSKDMDPLDEIPFGYGSRGAQSPPRDQLGFSSRQDRSWLNDKYVEAQAHRWRCAGSSVYEAGAPQRDAADASEKRAFDEALRSPGLETPPPKMRVAFTDRSVRLADDRRRSWLLSRKEPPVDGPEPPRGREKPPGPPLAAPAGAASGTSARGEPFVRMYNREEGAVGMRSPSPQFARRDSGMASKLIHNAGGMTGTAPEGSGGLRDDRVFLRSMGPKAEPRAPPRGGGRQGPIRPT